MDTEQSTETILNHLAWHESKSQERYERLAEQLHGQENQTMEGINSDKVNINLGEGGGGGGSMAAVIAALGNRNQGNDNAALIAALGNRNDDSANWAPFMAMLGNRDRDGGMDALWPILLLSLLGRRGGIGGDDGDGDGCARTALTQTILEQVGNIRADVPATALETQNAIQGALAQLALGIQQGFGNVKDVTQNGFALTARDLAAINQNVSAQGCETREVVLASENRIISKLDQNVIDDLRSRVDRAERSVEVNSLRAQVEVNQSVNTTQVQAQSQAQVEARFNQLFGLIGGIANQVQRVSQGQDVINFGTMAASGNQNQTTSQVR